MLFEGSGGVSVSRVRCWLADFQTEGAATEKVHPAMSVWVHGTISSGDRSCLTGATVWSMSLRYDGADVIRNLCVSTAVLLVMLCCTGSQFGDCRRGAALVRPPRSQTMRARLFCAHSRLLIGMLICWLWHVFRKNGAQDDNNISQ